MKTSNIIIISTIVVFIIGFAINAAGIKKMYDQTNWNDPYRNFTKHKLNKTFDRVYVFVSDSTDHWNADSLSIKRGNDNVLMLENDPNIHWQATDSGLVISLSQNAKGVLITPRIKQVIVSRVSCRISNFDLDSLQLNVSKEFSGIDVSNSKINYLDVSVSDHGILSLDGYSKINKLNMALRDGTFSSVTYIPEVIQKITPHSHIKLCGNALQWFAQKK